MEIIDNITQLLGDDLKQTITKDTKLKIAASCFSIYAYEALKKELEKIDSVEFIFTSPTFVPNEAIDNIKKERREFFIPKSERERTFYGSEFEIQLKNKLTQRAIAKECAEWIKHKATFRSNNAAVPMQTKVGEVYPDLLAEANAQAEKQANLTTGLRELAARISSRLSSGGFPEVEIDESERPRKVRYISEEEKKVRIEDELEADIEPLTRLERICKDTEALGEYECYRIEELETISKQINKFFSLDFEVDHALALLQPFPNGKTPS